MVMKIGILGLGLIGGCLGFDLRSQGYNVVGVSRQESTCQKAISAGIVNQAGQDLSLLASTEVVFVCTPIGLIVPQVKELTSHLSKSTIITDVGSVKTPIVSAITPIWENFLGGHPMAGKTEVGIDAAEPHLFVNRPYVLTPTDTTPNHLVTIVEEIVRSLGANIYYCKPDQHDRAVSWISHLPVIVSASLIAACLSETDPEIAQLAENFASSGFRDTSRVGGGNPELGVMMAEYNRQALLYSLHQYREKLDEFIKMIDEEKWHNLQHKLECNKQARPRYLE